MNSSPLIAILLPDMHGGGAEKIHLFLADHWLKKGFRVDFLLLRAEGELLRSIPERARVLSLDAPRITFALCPLFSYLRRERPTALLAAMWPLTVIAVLAAKFSMTRARIVISEHCHMGAQYADWGVLHNLFMRMTMGFAYRTADVVVAVSHGVAENLARLSLMAIKRFHVVFNPAAVHGTRDRPSRNPDAYPLILSVGSLKEQKNHKLLIDAFSLLRKEVPAKLRILGEGRLRKDLEAQVRGLGLSNDVSLPGFRPDPADDYAEAQLFVLSSDNEGFGNVIVEALEQGTPVVSTDCPGGPGEILDAGRYGALVPVGDCLGLAQAMKRALAGMHDPAALRARAAEFSVERAGDAYLDLLLPGWREEVARS